VDLSIENDGFAVWRHVQDRTDWYYTSGIRAEAVLGWAPALSRLLGGGGLIVCPPEQETDPCVLASVTVGQSIYTPAFLFSQEPDPGDRPYAGWLSVRTAFARLDPGGSSSLGVEVGVTGKASLAGPVHRWFHRSVGVHEPMGWSNQIPFEVAFALSYEARRVVPLRLSRDGVSFHFEPRGSLSLGTLRTGAAGGGSVLLGWNAAPSLDWAGGRTNSFYAQVSVGAEAELVLRDLFLDGSTFGESQRVDKESMVRRIQTRIQIGRGGLGLEFAATRTSPEFHGQKDPHVVGRVRLIVRP